MLSLVIKACGLPVSRTRQKLCIAIALYEHRLFGGLGFGEKSDFYAPVTRVLSAGFPTTVRVVIDRLLDSFSTLYTDLTTRATKYLNKLVIGAHA